MIELREDERLDYLLDERMKIVQSPSVFNFSLDAVLLANFVYVPIQKGHLLDLCTGNAVIPLLLSERTKGNITGVEIQDRIYDMAVRSIQYNKLEDRLSVIHGDINEMPSLLGNAQYDVITCNPPYFPTPSETEYNENPHLAIARHEIYCTLDDVVRVSSQLVRHGGKVAFVHRPERLLDILTLMRQYKIEPKRMRLVYPKEGKDANTLLVEGTKYGKAGLKILAPLYVYKENNEYTKEMFDILYGTRR